MAGLVSDNETSYNMEVEQLVSKLFLNVEKTKDIIVDFRTKAVHHRPLNINGSAVERVAYNKFLGIHIAEDSVLDHEHLPPGQKSSAEYALSQEATHNLLPGHHQ